MSQLNSNPDAATPANDNNTPQYSDMRRVSLSLAFSPARTQRRRHMRSANNWFKAKLGIGWRRESR